MLMTLALLSAVSSTALNIVLFRRNVTLVERNNELERYFR